MAVLTRACDSDMQTGMTRTEAIATIAAKLAVLDDEQLLAVADIVQSFEGASKSVRQLSARENALLERSKADFAAGRSLSHDEMLARLDERLARRGVPNSSS